ARPLAPNPARPRHEGPGVSRGGPGGGPSHFHAYATAYVIRQGRRFTVALTGVRRGEPLPQVVRRLLQQAGKAAVRPRYLLLDRGFCSVAVLRYLQAARYPFLMPLPLRRRQPDHPPRPSGSRVVPTS